MRVPLFDLSAQYVSVRSEILERLTKIVDTQKFVLGENVAELESRIQTMTGASHAVALASGTDALFLALLAAKVMPGDEVITTPFTFFATAGAITRVGAKPVFADIDPRTFNMDPSRLEPLITPKTRAVIPVHLYGLACDMDAIQKIAQKHGLAVIEDAAQSFGATYRGRQTGAIADAGCFSFYPTKNLGGAGDGGMLVTSSPIVAETVRLLRDHGSRKKYIHEAVGVNSRLDEMQAACLLPKLDRITGWNEARAEHARAYTEAFKGLPIAVPYVPERQTHIYHLYTIRSSKRDELARYLTDEGVGVGVYYPLPLHLQPCYQMLGHQKGSLPESERAALEVLSLPMFPEMSVEQRTHVIGKVRQFFGAKA